MGTNLARSSGYTEGSVNRGSGVGNRAHRLLLVSKATQIVNGQAVGGPSGAAVTTYTELTKASNRVPFAGTLVATITPGVVGTIALRVRGFDQFGERCFEQTPVVALTVATTNYVYLSKVFSLVESVQFVSTGLDSLASTISVGTRWDWTRTEDGNNHHIAGRNLGIPLPLMMRYRPEGTDLSRRHLNNRIMGLYPTAAAAFTTGTFTGVPTAAQTTTVDGIAYTWRASVSTTANEILIGANATECAQNLFAAINHDPLLAGVKYGSLTVAHPTVFASFQNGGIIVLTARQAGSFGNTITLANGASNFSFSAPTTSLEAGVSPLCEAMAVQISEITTTAANAITITLSPRQFEVGLAAAGGWTASLEKLHILRGTDVSTWAVADFQKITMAMRSLDGAF
jgi:hypothetical protein